MKRTVLAASLFLAIACSQPIKHSGPVYLDPAADLEARVEDALSRMTREEKIKIIHAQSKFSSAGVPRLGIPELWCTDGPHGVRAEVLWDKWSTAGWTNDSIIAYPALTCLAATWDRELAALYGKSIGEEARYRWYDTRGIEPLFAFGHGLSYTQFAYGEAKASSRTMRKGGTLTVSVPVTNIGERAGAEIVQLYISDPECSVDRPEKELKGFEKVWLEPGETKTVSITIDESALCFFDESAHAWVAEPGEFVARVGAASDDIRTTVKFNLK